MLQRRMNLPYPGSFRAIFVLPRTVPHPVEASSAAGESGRRRYAIVGFHGNASDRIFDFPRRSEVVEMVEVGRYRRFFGQQQINAAHRSLKTLWPSERHSSRPANRSYGVGVEIVDSIGHCASPDGQPRRFISVPQFGPKAFRSSGFGGNPALQTLFRFDEHLRFTSGLRRPASAAVRSDGRRLQHQLRHSRLPR